MRTIFADSFYFFALLSERDADHGRALSFSVAYTGQILTTVWILVEVGDGLSSSRQRSQFPSFCRELYTNPNIRVIDWDKTYFDEGLTLYEARPDTNWSLTDCISFVAMQQAAISEALTADHHIEQAGFHAVFRE